MTDELVDHRQPAPGGSGPRPGQGFHPGAIGKRMAELRLPRFAGLLLLAALVVIFGLMMPDTFLTVTTAASIARGQSIVIVLGLSLLVCLCAGVFDLSVAQNLGFGAVLDLTLMAGHGWNPALASAVTVIACTAVGVVNAVLVVKVGMDSFIATLGVSSVLVALTEMISGDVIAGPAPQAFQDIAGWQPLGIPVLVIYALALCLVVWYVVEHTPVGRRLYATGANKPAAALAGISTDRYVAGAFVTCAAGAGIASVLLSATVGSISPDAGASYLLPVFAGCFLAATQVKPGRYNVGGLLIALFLLGTGVKGLQLLGGQVWIPDMFNGVALLTAVGLAVYLQRREIRRSRARVADAPGQNLPRVLRDGTGEQGLRRPWLRRRPGRARDRCPGRAGQEAARRDALRPAESHRGVAQPDRDDLQRDHRPHGTGQARRSHLLVPADQDRSNHRGAHPAARLPQPRLAESP